MDRLIATLLSVLIVLVLTTGILVWRADQRARADAERQACIQRTEATATIAVFLPTVLTDPDNETRQARVNAIETLSHQLDDC